MGAGSLYDLQLKYGQQLSWNSTHEPESGFSRWEAECTELFMDPQLRHGRTFDRRTMKHFQRHVQPERFPTPRAEGASGEVANVPFFASEFSGLQRTFTPRKLAPVIRSCEGTTALFVPGPAMDCHHLVHNEDCDQCNMRLLQQRSERQWKRWSWSERPYSLTPLGIRAREAPLLQREFQALMEGCADQTARKVNSWMVNVDSDAARLPTLRCLTVPRLRAHNERRGSLAHLDDHGGGGGGPDHAGNALQGPSFITRAATHGSSFAPWFPLMELKQAFAIQHGCEGLQNGLQPDRSHTSWLMMH